MRLGGFGSNKKGPVFSSRSGGGRDKSRGVGRKSEGRSKSRTKASNFNHTAMIDPRNNSL